MNRVEQLAEGVTLYLGDCREILPTLGRMDAVVTDPPFGVGFKYESHDDRPEAYEGGYGVWIWNIIEAAERLCKPGSPIFVWQASPNMRSLHEWFPRDWRLFCAAKNFVQMRPTPMQWSYDPVVVWWVDGTKGWSAGTANRDFHIANTAPVMATPNNIEKGHPCPRPLGQAAHIIEQWCRPGSVILDPFMGSGTTGLAAVKLGRKFCGIEKEQKYFDISRQRIANELRRPSLFEIVENEAAQGTML
jgi:DNA modification methylase